MSKRSEAFASLIDILGQAIRFYAQTNNWTETPKIEKQPANEQLEIPEQSLVVVRDLGMSTPIEEFGRGPGKAVKGCSVKIQIEAYMLDQPGVPKEDALDGLMTYIGEVIETDPTLGGAVENSDIEEADVDSFGDEGQDTVAGTAITVNMVWYSERALA